MTQKAKLFKIVVPLLPQIGLNFGLICYSAHMPYFFLVIEYYAEKQKFLIHIILCNILCCGPLIYMNSYTIGEITY